MTNLLTRLGFLFLRVFQRMPLGLQAAAGNLLGWLAYYLASKRKQVARRNLELCFPEKTPPEIRQLLKKNILGSVRATLEHGLLIWAGEARIKKLVQLEGEENLSAHLGKPLILLAPHFIGLDMGGVRMTAYTRIASLYSRARNPVVDHYLLQARSRFNRTVLTSKHDGIRPVISAIRSGLPFYYLPDQDAGRSESIFVPFFGIPAATVPALSRLAKVTGAKVVPAVTRQLPGGKGYVLKFYPAWENFPGADVETDTRRMNAFIEERIREMPEQYLWTHRRFKTRPEGEPGLYD